MGYCFHLYTPDLEEQDSGKFVACAELLFNTEIQSQLQLPSIGFYERNYFDKKYIDIYNSSTFMSEENCYLADKLTETTFFTDFLRKHDCSGIIIKIT